MALTQVSTLFGRIALHNKLVTQEQLNRAIAEISANPGMRLGDALVTLGYLSDSQVGQILKLQKSIQEKLRGKRSDEPASPGHAATVPGAPSVGGLSPDAPAPSEIADYSHIEQYLHFARQNGASDIHISVGCPPSLRLNGELQFLNRESFTAQDTDSLFRSFLSKDQIEELTEKKVVEFCLSLSESDRYRVCIFKQRNGLDGAFRVISQGIPSVQDLGLPEEVLRLTEHNQGIVLITGPSGHGKSTTMSALVEHVNRTRSDHVITIEDPIEQILQAKRCVISQREVGSHTDSFASALRAALREDPDIIVIGELRDLETISLAITAAETGHLVFGTTHTTSAMRTVGRILDVFPPDQQAQIRAMISESLKGVVSQYLVPRADGKGRALAYELLVNTGATANLIRDDRVFQIRSQMQAGKKQGMVLMDDSLADLVRKKVVAADVAVSFAEDPKSFQAEVNR